jgi:predicted oxidoreductase (fatty acid repression mutant protein)
MISQLGDHANGMAQILVWTALELEGLGASLQHMQAIPAVETALKEFCSVPEDYSLKAHLTFGDITGDHPIMPDKLPFSETLKIIK